MPAVTTMSVMHENVHERTGQEWEPYKNPEDMRTVLSKEQHASNDEESKHHEACSRCQEAALPLMFELRVIMHRH
jgi:hypothetical protein